MTRFLLKNFSRPNFKDFAGRTALSFAVANSNLDIVKLLLCFKADPLITNNQGVSIQDICESQMSSNTDLEISKCMRLCIE